MYVIAGLGNPGREYEGTRHNVGFMTLDALADKYNIDVREKAFKGLIGKGMIEGNKVILVKPQTYMNLSGECIRQVMEYFPPRRGETHYILPASEGQSAVPCTLAPATRPDAAPVWSDTSVIPPHFIQKRFLTEPDFFFNSM